MTPLQLLFHLLNFMLPALVMAALMPWAGRWIMGQGGLTWRCHFGWHLLVGVAVLVGGLLLQGRDGAMVTYAVLVVVAGTLEWLLHRGWPWS